MKPYLSRQLRSQKGSALLVSLVMIFMLSIMGISAMRGSNLEQRMAVNSIHAAKCAQLAESSTEIVLNRNANLRTAYNQLPENPGDVRPPAELTTNLQDSTEVVSTVDLQYMGEGPVLGASMGEGTDSFVALRFEATGHTTVDAANTECNVRQGAYQKAPATP